jgi:DNA-binding CsgD family transcriptional regulator/PAS domain-containing protein
MRSKGAGSAPTQQRLVDAIYDAALHPEQWTVCLQQVEGYLRARSSQIFLQDVQNRDATFTILNGIDAGLMQAYYRHYVFLEPGFTWRQTQPEGTVSASNFLTSDAELRDSEYYNDCLRKHRVFYTAGAKLATSAGRTASIGVQRRHGDGPFTQEDLGRLSRLVPHLRRAFAIARVFAQAESQRRALAALLEGLPYALFLVDAHARVSYANGRGTALLAQPDALGLAAGRLAATHAATQPHLARLIAGAVATGRGQGTAAGGALAVPRPTGEPPLVALVIPLRHALLSEELGGPPVYAAVCVADSSRPAPPDAETLQALFGLTPAEARAARALAAGASPQDAAVALAISPHTLRTQLRACYDKLGVRGQAELVRSVLSSPAALATGPEERPD